jgi:maltooligosyltrehalose trehalohydrolase
MLFQGEEWGASTPFRYFTSHPDEELGLAVSLGRRKEFAAFGWDPGEVPDPQDPATFLRSKLQWDELDDDRHADLLEWHKRLLKLRRATGGLGVGRMGDVETSFDEERRWLLVRRAGMTIVANLSVAPVEVPVEGDLGTALIWSPGEPQRSEDSLKLEPESVVIYSSREAA